MSAPAKDALPPNIQEFNEITAVIYVAHPFPKDLDPDEVGRALGVQRATVMPSGQKFNIVFSHTLSWLLSQNYVWNHGDYPRQRVHLTDKALTAMNVAIPSIGKTIGTQLTEAAQNAASVEGKRELVRLIGDFFGSFFASAVKGMSS